MNNYFKNLAAREGTTPQEVNRTIQELIDAAWATSDPGAKHMQHQLFGNSKPTPEQLILTLASEIVKQRNQPTSSTHCS